MGVADTMLSTAQRELLRDKTCQLLWEVEAKKGSELFFSGNGLIPTRIAVEKQF